MNNENVKDPVQPGTAIIPTQPAGTMQTVNPLTQVNQLEGFEDAVISPANMVVVQKTTRDTEAKPGTFKDMITGQCFQSLQIVPLKIQANPGPRVLFQEGAPFGSDPICRSNDGLRPAINAETPQSEFCKDCKHASWDSWRTSKKPPACKEKVRLLFVERQSGLPFIISFGGRSVGPAKNFLKSIMRLAALAISRGERLGIYDFTAEMSLKEIIDNKGAYYVVLFKNISRVRTPGEFGPLYQELVRARDVLTKAPVVEEITGEVTDSQIVPSETSVVDDDIPF